MLVLTRKAGEQIIIGDNIRLTVVSLGNGRVKIGITAPQDVKQAAEETSVKPQEVVCTGLHNRIAGKFPAEPTTEKPVARSPIARRKSR
jgi:carbon storage regulator